MALEIPEAFGEHSVGVGPERIVGAWRRAHWLIMEHESRSDDDCTEAKEVVVNERKQCVEASSRHLTPVIVS